VVPEGTADVPVNQLIAVPRRQAGRQGGRGGKRKGAAPAAARRPRNTKPAAAAASAAQTQTKPQPTRPPSPGAAARRRASAPAPAPTATATSSPPAGAAARQEAGIDIARIAGSGPHGRVVARDVAQAKQGGGLRAPAAAPAGTPAPGVQAPSDEKIRALFKPGSYEVVPHDNMRRIIAQRLVQAKSTIPHFYLTVSCTIDKLLAAREDINATAPNGPDGKPKCKLSVNDFVIKALALALVKVPDANVTWTEGGMLKHKHADVGVAVALPNGLITPVVRKAETKSLTAISAEMKDLAARARARRLKPEEYQGGSTAISNLGMYGVEEFAAVINPPHATILAVGAGEERAVARDGKLAVATQMKLTLSTDHRAVDGALGAELIGAIRRYLESPTAMLV
jgi:pyruvate dehydrogenase E2 component (dihydrolipoamide acetyltransferase)